MRKASQRSAADSGSSVIQKRKRLATGLALTLALILTAPAGSALAQICVVDETTKTASCIGTVTGNGTLDTVLGGGKHTGTGDEWQITIGDGTNPTQVTNGGQTVISVNDGVDNVNTITVKQNATVQGNSNSGTGLETGFGSGPNVIEANNNTTIVIEQGGTVQQLGNTNDGEAINVHGYGNKIVNNGLIHSKNGAALWFQDQGADTGGHGRNQVDNHGTISTGKGAGYNVFGSSANSASQPGIIFNNYGTVNGSLRFGGGNDSLTFGTDSKITGNVDGGGGSNDLTLEADAGKSQTLEGSVANFTSIKKTGAGAWAIEGQVPATPNDPNPSSPIEGALNRISAIVVEEGLLNIVGAAPKFNGTVDIQNDGAGKKGTLSVQAQSINNATRVKVDGDLVFDQTPDDAYTGVGIEGKGMVIKQGDGTLVMNSKTGNTYSGDTWIRGGALAVDRDTDLGAASGRVILGSDTVGGNNNTGELRFDASFNLGPGRDIIIKDGGGVINTNGADITTTISQAVRRDSDPGAHGDGDLIKSGAGALILGNAANTYGGNTVIQGGTLGIVADGSLGNNPNSRVTMYDGATLRMEAANVAVNGGRTIELVGGPSASAAINTNNNNATVDAKITGQGKLIKDGLGALTLTDADNDYQGGTQVRSGTLAIDSDGALGVRTSELELQGDTTLQLDGDVTMTNRQVYLSGGSATIDTQTHTGQIDSTVRGSGQLVKVGSGDLNLYGNNTYSGGTAIEEGVVAIKSNSGLGSGGVEFGTLTSNGTLRLDADNIALQAAPLTLNAGGGTIDTNGFNGSVAGAIGGPGQLTKASGGTLTLTGANNYTGNTDITGGALQLGNGGITGSIVGDIAIAGGSDLIVNRSNTYTLDGLVSGGGRLIQRGSGTTRLTNPANSYTGGTDIENGTLAISANAALGSGGALNFGTAATGGTLLLEADINNLGDGHTINLNQGGGTIDTGGHNGRVAQQISGIGALTKSGAGTLTLTNNTNNYAGGTNIREGTLAIADAGSLGGGLLSFGGANTNGTLQLDADLTLTNSPVTLNAGGGTIDTKNNEGVLTSAIGGPGGLTKTGGGILRLTSRDSTYTGGTTVKQGTLAVAGNGSLGADSGALTLDGNTTLRLDNDFSSASRPVILSGDTATINTLANTGTFGGNITGLGGLDKTGSGTLALLGISGYQGNTRIKEGTLVINSNASLGAGGNTLEMWNRTILKLQGNVLMPSRPIIIGDTTITGNAVPTGLPNYVTFDTNGFNMRADSVIRDADNADGGGVRLDKTGAGVLALYGANTYSGSTWVKAGTVAINNLDSLGTGNLYLGNHSNPTYYGEAGGQNSPGALRFDSDLGGGFYDTLTFLNEAGGIIDTQDYTVLVAADTFQDGNDDDNPLVRLVSPYRVGSGRGSLTKVGSGVLGIDGFQYYRGSTLVNEGTLRIYSYDHLNTAGNYLAPIGVVNTGHVEIAAGARLEGQGVIGNALNSDFAAK